jgi:hypothetical protein
MYCARCGEPALSNDQRFCHACGAPVQQATSRIPYNGVGDGAKAGGVALLVLSHALSWRHPGRLILYIGASVLALLALAVAVLAIVGAIVAAVATLTPVIVFVTIVYLLWRPRRRRYWR